MTRKTRTWLAAAVITLGLAVPANAFPPFPPFQCPWHEAKECPCSSYSCLHYLIPAYYECRAYHTPMRYMYAWYPGDMLLGYALYQYPCRTTSPQSEADKYIEVGRAKKETADASATLPPPPQQKAPQQK
jgi:hypothetical protein